MFNAPLKVEKIDHEKNVNVAYQTIYILLERVSNSNKFCFWFFGKPLEMKNILFFIYIASQHLVNLATIQEFLMFQKMLLSHYYNQHPSKFMVIYLKNKIFTSLFQLYIHTKVNAGISSKTRFFICFQPMNWFLNQSYLL